MVKQHIPILVDEILSYIPDQARTLADGTFGHGGHTLSFIKHFFGSDITLFLQCYDRDHIVIEHGKQRVQDEYPQVPPHITVEYINDTYAQMFSHAPVEKFDFILLDLGINREHVTDNRRGFSFQGEGPLDMRFDTTSGKTAYEIIQESSLDELKRRFIEYGDFREKRADDIAHLIYTNKKNPLLMTTTGFTQLLKEIKI